MNWNHFYLLFELHCVCSGVRQGSFLSPFLFAVYLDGLLVELSKFGVVVIGETVLQVLLVMYCCGATGSMCISSENNAH